MTTRFDAVPFDTECLELQGEAKRLCLELEEMILSIGGRRATALALTKLEECHLWIGKAIRDKQLDRSSDLKK